MKATRIFLALVTIFVTLPLQIYLSFLLYKHVHATDLMWFLWWLSFPLNILFTVINTIADKILDADKKLS
jgi:hypothetical protein